MKLSSSRFDMETSRLERPTLKNYSETANGGASGNASTVIYDIDLSLGNTHPVTLSVAGTLLRFINPPTTGTSGNFTLLLKQDATGGRTVIWPESVFWANGTEPTLTSTPNATDIFSFFTINGGMTWQGSLALANPFKARTLWSWGSNSYSQLGDGATVNRSSPAQVGSLANWSKISGGTQHSLAIKTDGTLWAWGNGATGRLGDGTTVSKSSTVQIGSLTNWANIASGTSHSLAVKIDGTLWGWGDDSNGQLGDGTVVSKSSPIQIGSLTNWLSVSAGYKTSIAIKTDGTLWSFGRNATDGQLGDGTKISKSSPIQIGSLTNWFDALSGYKGSIALTTDGTLWSFGNNTSDGQLGDGTTISKSSPVQIGALTNWTGIGKGKHRFFASKTDGTLWAWGRNNSGQIGDGTKIKRSSPVQVGNLSNWSTMVSGGYYHSIAIKTDGSLWGWGGGSEGRLGDGTTIDKSSPIQIGALTNWTSVSCGDRHSITTLRG